MHIPFMGSLKLSLGKPAQQKSKNLLICRKGRFLAPFILIFVLHCWFQGAILKNPDRLTQRVFCLLQSGKELDFSDLKYATNLAHCYVALQWKRHIFWQCFGNKQTRKPFKGYGQNPYPLMINGKLARNQSSRLRPSPPAGVRAWRVGKAMDCHYWIYVNFLLKSSEPWRSAQSTWRSSRRITTKDEGQHPFATKALPLVITCMRSTTSPATIGYIAQTIWEKMLNIVNFLKYDRCCDVIHLHSMHCALYSKNWRAFISTCTKKLMLNLHLRKLLAIYLTCVRPPFWRIPCVPKRMAHAFSWLEQSFFSSLAY